MAGIATAVRSRLRQFFGLVLVPATVLLAGRRLGWKFVRLGSRWERLYAPEVEAMSKGYDLLTGTPPDSDLRRRLRLQLLMERASWFRSRLFGVRRAARIIGRVSGDWPARGPFLAYGFHRAGGFAVLDHLAYVGHAPVTLQGPVIHGRGIERRLCRIASRQMARLGGGELLTTGGSYRRIKQLTKEGRVVLATVDVPPAAGQATMDIQVKGLRLHFPEGLFRLAVDLGIPVAFFYTRLESDGRYTLAVRTLDAPDTPETVSQAAAEMLEESLRLDPSGWLYLNGLQSLLAPSARQPSELSRQA